MNNGEQPQAAHAATSDSDASGLWVFGYGSLCWHPGFHFRRSAMGFVKGYARKFWQGNTTHRGTETQPGRVATLVEERDGVVWGRAFELSGEAALPYLANRECKLGGYITKFATFIPKRPCGDDGSGGVPGMPGMPGQPFPVLLYVATPGNRLWLGEAPLGQIARQIVSCRGATGHNAEYLLRLADYLRDAAPEADDDHLFSLEQLVRCEIRQRRLCLDTLMGEPAAKQQGGDVARNVEAATQAMSSATVIDAGLDDDDHDDDHDVVVDARARASEQALGHAEAGKGAAAVGEVHIQEQQQQQHVAAVQPEPSLAFTSRVPNKKLRCVNI